MPAKKYASKLLTALGRIFIAHLQTKNQKLSPVRKCIGYSHYYQR